MGWDGKGWNEMEAEGTFEITGLPTFVSCKAGKETHVPRHHSSR